MNPLMVPLAMAPPWLFFVVTGVKEVVVTAGKIEYLFIKENN